MGGVHAVHTDRRPCRISHLQWVQKEGHKFVNALCFAFPSIGKSYVVIVSLLNYNLMVTFNFVGLGLAEIIFVLIAFVPLIFAFLQLVKSELQPVEKILWALFLFLIPIIGPVAFLIYNSMKRKKA